MPIHHFNTDHAVRWGIPAALILERFQTIASHNRTHGRYQYDGRSWVFASAPGLMAHYPYLTESAIRRTLADLCKNGVLRKGQIASEFGGNSWDRTMYYAFEDEAYEFRHLPVKNDESSQNSPSVKSEGCISQNEQMDASESADVLYKIECGKSLKESDDLFSGSPPTSQPPSKKKPAPALSVLPEWIDPDTWEDWVGHRREKDKKPLTSRAIKGQIKQLASWRDEGHDPNAIIAYAIARNWQGLYLPPSTSQPSPSSNPTPGTNGKAPLLSFEENFSRLYDAAGRSLGLS